MNTLKQILKFGISMVTAMTETTDTDSRDIVSLSVGMNNQKFKAEAIAELNFEIRQTQNEDLQCEEYMKMISGQPYAAELHHHHQS
jgi:hypothetical protein